jgi:hypothetical protein
LASAAGSARVSTRLPRPTRWESQLLGERGDRSREPPSAAKALRSSGDLGLRAMESESSVPHLAPATAGSVTTLLSIILALAAAAPEL